MDARIPLSSRNPEIDKLVCSKPRIIALNKSDLSDPEKNRLWAQHFRNRNIEVIYTNAITGAGINELKNKLKALTRQKTESAAARGRIGRAIKTMVVGIPNVGKSAFINKIAGRSGAQTGDRPGVTRSKQWVRINPEIQLLDTPGILWPKFEDVDTGLNLAFTGAIKDEIMDTAELAAKLMERLACLYPDELMARYKLGQVQDRTGLMLLEEAGRKRGCLVSGGEVDLYRIAAIVLDEFRGGRIGRITLENPPEEALTEEQP